MTLDYDVCAFIALAGAAAALRVVELVAAMRACGWRWRR